jgi:peptide/nickel transport system substrate-binding protein
MDPKLNIDIPDPDKSDYYQMHRWTYEGMTQDDNVVIKAAYSEDPRYWLLMYGDGGFAPTMPQHRMLFSVIYNEAEKQFKIEPELVTDWELAEDGMSMTLQLRQDAVFHDGHPLDSGDVKWTFDAILDPASGSTYWGDFSAAIASIEAPDDYTVILNFAKETPEILTLLAPTGGYTSIYPEHILGDIPHDQLRTSDYNTVTPPPGLGSMKFSDWKSMEFIKLEAFDDYYDGRPLVDEYILEIIPAAETALASLESGEVHIMLSWTDENLPQMPRLRDEGKINIVSWPRDGVRFIAINNDHPILVNKFVRQALAYATPYQSLIDNVFDGDGVPANSPISPNMWAYKEDTKYYEYDLDKAREALRKAGYPEWPPEVEEAQQADILVPAAGGLIGGLIIGVAVMYFLRREQ